MNNTLKKTLIFVAKVIIHGVLWYIAFIFGLVILASLHSEEEKIMLNGLESVLLLALPSITSWFLGKQLRNLYEKKTLPVSAIAVEPVIPAVEHLILAELDSPELNLEPVHAQPPELVRSPTPLELVDAMDGHAFEYWCADLLRDNGFTNVSVTRGSGDQGVDVLAEKEGIRYAIQCKCYSHDLGNTPVQEINAGRTIYHCHIGAVLTNRHFTKGAKEAAEATGVLLWDRDWIKAHLNETETTQRRSAIDPLIWDALDLVRAANGATPAIVERGLGIGCARAGRIVDQLEELGYIGPFRGSQPQEILK